MNQEPWWLDLGIKWSEEAMGSCFSCPDKESIPDNHQSKFKVVNVDDDGNELGAGIMELTEDELVLRTRKCDAVKWPYLCLRRYGYDSNLFSFESGRRCQTGQGIFAFKCSRAEEIFNMLQDIMHNNSISVVEEPVFEPTLAQTEPELPLTPHTPTTPGNILPTLPNGSLRYPSLGDASSHPSSRHPSVGSTCLPSLGEESTHPLLAAEEAVRGHTYVNTTGLLEQHSPSLLEVPAELNVSLSDGEEAVPQEAPDPGPRVQLEPEGARFVLDPTPVQRQRQREASVSGEQCIRSSSAQNSNGSVVSHTSSADASDSVRSEETSPGAPENFTVSRRRSPLIPDTNVNNSAQRRTALLDYENLPALPPLREHPKGSSEDEDREEAVNGFHYHRQHSPDPTHYYINTENVTAPLSANKLESARWRDRSAPTFFNFDFRRPCLESHRLNYIEVETETENSSNPQTPKTPTSPLPQTPTRRTELYAVIDVERTAAMSSLQKALPRYDGTSRKTRHNSVDLPM
ncbi:fibroblast growth factor receptor substrate 2-like [Carassius auratus]|uniref:Fibroblast growth factor receptor substrate 2-like n=1 Tax=Carassius auratus TaxID=7957 RepID=A0A6P6JH05_CARAU|nr:fibroblast growth factor receptor substrate 2-like [Carassius auratus]XP_026058950.1 fibroblast growth factor receptor substrate 2-like [Carassius auratus]XP_052453893.1 fibroblast growth factor receptor substrate 2 [Carassius gibelio]